MSLHNVRAVIDRLHMREVLIAPEYAGLLGELQQLVEADQSLEEAAAIAHRKELLSMYGYTPSVDEKPFAYADGVAIIPVHGLLVNRFSWSWSFITGYNFVRMQLDAAMNDPDVKLIVFDVNSCGGEAAGCFELCDDIFVAGKSKNIISVVDSNCYSGAYAIAAATNKIYVTPSGGAGSIGVYTMHINVSGMLKQAGIEVKLIQAGTHKTDGNPYESLPKDVQETIQANVESTRTVFVDSVARYRSMDAKVIRDTEGRSYRSDQALALGLIDAVQPPAKALQAYFDESEPPGSEGPTDGDDIGEEVMAEPTKPGEVAKPVELATGAQPAPVVTAPAAPAAGTEQTNSAETLRIAGENARTAERTRIQAITGCDEAKGRESLATHFAMETDMSPEAAKKALAAAPKTTTAAAGNQFKEAMDGGKHPEINNGADEPGAGEGEAPKVSKASGILAAQAAATGRPIPVAKK